MSEFVKIFKNYQNCQDGDNCQKLSLPKIVNIVQIVKKWEFPIRPVVTEILTLYAQVVTTHALVLSSCNLTLKKVRVRARRSFDRSKRNRFQPRDGGGKQWQERSPNQAKAANSEQSKKDAATPLWNYQTEQTCLRRYGAILLGFSRQYINICGWIDIIWSSMVLCKLPVRYCWYCIEFQDISDL